MDITEVRVRLRNEERLKGFVNVTFDDAFVVRGMKVISGNNGYFVAMPSRRLPDGSHQDVAHPVTTEMRSQIEEKVLQAYEAELETHAKV